MTAQFPTIRLILSIATLLQFSIETVDIKSAYIQAENFVRGI